MSLPREAPLLFPLFPLFPLLRREQFGLSNKPTDPNSSFPAKTSFPYHFIYVSSHWRRDRLPVACHWNCTDEGNSSAREFSSQSSGHSGVSSIGCIASRAWVRRVPRSRSGARPRNQTRSGIRRNKMMQGQTQQGQPRRPGQPPLRCLRRPAAHQRPEYYRERRPDRVLLCPH